MDDLDQFIERAVTALESISNNLIQLNLSIDSFKYNVGTSDPNTGIIATALTNIRADLVGSMQNEVILVLNRENVELQVKIRELERRSEDGGSK